MKTCRFCGAEFPDERPYEHCTAQDCVTAWKTERRASMSVVLIPKSGFTVTYKNDKSSTRSSRRH